MLNTRQQNRLTFLQNKRANDPQVAKLQALQKQPAQTATTATTTGTTTPQTGGGVTVASQPVDTARITNRIRFLKRANPNDPEISRLQKRLSSAQAPQPPTPDATTTPTAPNTDPVTTPSADPTKVANMLFPGVQTFQNYQSSPTYDFQAKKLEDSLAKHYAARGLTGSGAEAQGLTDAMTQLGASEADRAMGVANTNADRLMQLQEAAANRGERTSQNQFNNTLSILQLLASQSPMQYAFEGTGKYADTVREQGAANAKLLGDMYQRVFSSGGGGGGVAPQPYQSPTQQNPNYGMLDILGNSFGSQTNNDFMNSINSLFA